MRKGVLARWRRGLLSLLLLLSEAAVAAAQVLLTILHMSEYHGAVLSFDQGQEKGIGGFAMRATLVDQVRAAGARPTGYGRLTGGVFSDSGGVPRDAATGAGPLSR